MKRENLGDGWYESEEPTRLAFVTELQRIRRRFAVRPVRVLLLAALLTGALTYKIATKPRIYEADVVLAITEGEMATVKGSIPFSELKEYVTTVLLPDAKLIALIEKRNLHRLRRTLGPQYAINELREATEIEIWKNSFTHFHEVDANARKSARIGITVMEEDPDLAYDVAHDLATIVIATHEEQRRKVADALAREVKLMHGSMSERLENVTGAIAVTQTAIASAQKDGRAGLAAALQVDLSALVQEEKHLETELATIAASPEAAADRATRAGLGTRIEVVEERRPDRQEQSGFVLALVIVVVGTGALLGSAVFLGAFDSRIHDTDDVARLDLPVLGHVPGFPGDHVGSLEARGARGARRARVPSFLRWRSQR